MIKPRDSYLSIPFLNEDSDISSNYSSLKDGKGDGKKFFELAKNDRLKRSEILSKKFNLDIKDGLIRVVKSDCPRREEVKCSSEIMWEEVDRDTLIEFATDQSIIKTPQTLKPVMENVAVAPKS